MGRCQAEKRWINGRVPGWEKTAEWMSARLKKNELMAECQAVKRWINGIVPGWEKIDKWESARLRKDGWMDECQVEKEWINVGVSSREKRNKWESVRLRKEGWGNKGSFSELYDVIHEKARQAVRKDKRTFSFLSTACVTTFFRVFFSIVFF